LADRTKLLSLNISELHIAVVVSLQNINSKTGTSTDEIAISRAKHRKTPMFHVKQNSDIRRIIKHL
jgi:hypothetical protein